MAKLRRREFISGATLAIASGAIGLQVSAAQPQTLSDAEAAKLGAKSFAASPQTKPWTVPQRKGPAMSTDVHTHWAPEGYLKLKAEFGQPDFLDAVNADLDRRVKLMADMGIQTNVLTLGGFMPWQWVTPEQGVRVARVTNDAAIEAHNRYPKNFVAGIELPVADPAGSLQELNRVAGKPGMIAVHLPNSLAGREYLFEPEFAPVLSRCHELGLPLLIHPLDGEPNWYSGHRLADAYSGVDPNANAISSRFPGLTNSIGETFEQATTMAKFIVSGTLDKYPNLIPIILHGGGALPYVYGRLDGRGGARGNLKQPFQQYLRRFYFDSLVYYPIALRFLIDLVGIDRIMLGTDNMFGPGNQMTEYPHSIIDQLNLPEGERDLILQGNARRLFKI
jgi:aminocarboxymuconate-semialdehyde decarboxylase